jgi:hypothetical protein
VNYAFQSINLHYLTAVILLRDQWIHLNSTTFLEVCVPDALNCPFVDISFLLGPNTPLKTAWPQSASELYRPKDSRLLAKLEPTFEDRGCCEVSTTNSYGRILGFIDRSRYFFFQVAFQLYSRGWVDPFPDPLLLIKSGSAGNRTRDIWICS